MIGKWIFHGDQKSRDLHENSRDLSYYEIFQQKILKSQTLKKMWCIGIFMPRCLILPLKKKPQNRRLSLKKPLEIAYYVFGPLTKNAPKIWKKNPQKYQSEAAFK